jgi:hypothetical protein
VVAIAPTSTGLDAGHLACRVEDRLHDVLVAGAAAEVALQREPDVCVRRARMLVEVALRRHDHPRRAVAALQTVVAAERFLERMERVPVREALDRGDLATVGLRREERAGLHRLAVEEHRARAAGRGVATDVRAGQSEGLPEEVHEERARLDVGLARHPVDGDGDVRHGRPPFPGERRRV